MQHLTAIKMSLGYVLFGALWIPFADRIIMIFIGITAIMLYSVMKRIETSWKQEKEELDTYKHIVSASIDLRALVDRDYRYKAVSRSYAEALGKKPKEVVGQRVPDIVGRELFEKQIKKDVVTEAVKEYIQHRKQMEIIKI